MVTSGLRDLGRLLLAVVLVAASARASVSIPGSAVPQSLQTLAVVVVGAWLGPRDGALALALYMVAGAVGLPVFADGAGGFAHLVGPTLGYLLGFVLGAALVGWWVRRPWGGGVVGAFFAATAAHVLILGLGWARLGALVGPMTAWETGVEPFLLGGVAKSVVAALLWVGMRSWVEPPGEDLVG